MQDSARARAFGIGSSQAQQLQHCAANVQSSSVVHSSTKLHAFSPSGTATRDGGGRRVQLSGSQSGGRVASQRLSRSPSVRF
jgi:hypothetical protein